MIISDASVFIYLIKTGHLWLLPELYDTVVTTEVVLTELDGVAEEAAAIRNSDWIRTVGRDTYQPYLPQLQRYDLDPGERSCFACALSPGDHLVLVDDGRARVIAAELGIRISDLLGVLSLAKEREFIDEVTPIVDEMVGQGFRLDSKFRRSFLRSIGEEQP